MATATIPEFQESVSDLKVLTQEQESFCAWVASGVSYAESARRVGWTVSNGYYTKELPQVKARIAELIETRQTAELGGIATKSWIETHLVRLIARLEEEDLSPKQLGAVQVEVQTLMALAKLKGHVIERKATLTATARLDGGSAIEGQVGSYLEALDPAARGEIEDRVRAIESRRGTRKRLSAPSRTKSVPTGATLDTIDTTIDTTCTDVRDDVRMDAATCPDSPAGTAAADGGELT